MAEKITPTNINYWNIGRRRGLVVRAVDYGVEDPQLESRRGQRLYLFIFIFIFVCIKVYYSFQHISFQNLLQMDSKGEDTGSQSNTLCSGFFPKNALFTAILGIFSTGTYAGIGTQSVSSLKML